MHLNLSHNKLSGEIPLQIGECHSPQAGQHKCGAGREPLRRAGPRLRAVQARRCIIKSPAAQCKARGQALASEESRREK